LIGCYCPILDFVLGLIGGNTYGDLCVSVYVIEFDWIRKHCKLMGFGIQIPLYLGMEIKI